MSAHPHHPPHPQFLDVDWPRNHDGIPAQPLQLENEFDIDPSRYDILQGDLQPPPHMDRRRHQQNSGFMMDSFNGQPQPFGGSGDYVFTFPNTQTQPQQFGQVYGGSDGGQQFYPDTPYSGVSNQSMPSSPFYPDDVSAYTFGQTPGMTLAQHGRSSSNPNPGPTPTIRSFQGDVSRTPVYSNVPSPATPNFALSPHFGMAMQTGVPFRGDLGSEVPHASKRMRALDDGEGDVSSAEGDGQEGDGAQAKGANAKPPKP